MSNMANLMTELKSKRPYQSQRRREQAEATRQKIIKAAYRLFAADGYNTTTLPAIANAAGVSLPTVTGIFGTKFALLDALIRVYVRGDEAPTPLVTRPWWQAMLQEPDPAEQLRLLAAISRGIHERTTDIFEIVRGAAVVDPEIAALRQGLTDGRLKDGQTVVDSLAAKSALHAGVDAEKVRDIMWALTSGDMYRTLVVDRGWSADDYQSWLAHTLIATLLRED
jgi:AcrR family transcriptional regulator